MNNDTASRQDRVDELIADFLQQTEAGISVSPEQWLDLHPEYRAELSTFFANHLQLEQLAAPLRTAADPLSRCAADRRLGDFLIRREIGRGGMGVVYEAEQVSLGRRVALKVLPFAAMLDEHQLRRFKNEAHAAAVLQHPHIVSVFYVGCEWGVHFYAMPLIDGRSLLEIVEQTRERTRASFRLGPRIRLVPIPVNVLAKSGVCPIDRRGRRRSTGEPESAEATLPLPIRKPVPSPRWKRSSRRPAPNERVRSRSSASMRPGRSTTRIAKE